MSTSDQQSLSTIPITVLARILNIGECTAYKWAKKNLLPCKKGQVRKDFADALIRDWLVSCTQMDAARALKVRPSAVNVMLSRGILEGIKVMGKIRPRKESVKAARKIPKTITAKDIIHPERRGFARLRKKKIREFSAEAREAAKGVTWRKWDSDTAREAALVRWSKRKTPIELYASKSKDAAELGSRRLVTVASAAKFLNLSAAEVEQLPLRSYEFKGRKLLFAQSVEAHKG